VTRDHSGTSASTTTGPVYNFVVLTAFCGAHVALHTHPDIRAISLQTQIPGAAWLIIR
jgi:hypothetical protein